jgi:hypothetical protein
MKKHIAILLATVALATGAVAQSPNSGWTPDMAYGNDRPPGEPGQASRGGYSQRDYLRERERERVQALQRERDGQRAQERRLRERERERERQRDRARAGDRDGDGVADSRDRRPDNPRRW